MVTSKITPTISVIMPCFNAENHLQSSISSILEQTFSNFELLIVNDGSTDKSISIAKSFNDSRIKIINQNNQGVCNARNNAISIASGEYIAFQDADDTWHKSCLDELYNALKMHPDAVLAYCGWQNVGLPGPRGEPFIPPDYENENKLINLFENCLWPINACLTKKRAIVDAGGFDKRFKTSEDYLLWLKIAKDQSIILVPKILAFYNHHGEAQATLNKSGMAINHLLAQQSFLREYPYDENKLSVEIQKKLMFDYLIKQGFDCYWNRELHHARIIFRIIMKSGYGDIKYWKYMLPALLPFKLHKYLVYLLESK
ncbi:MAG: glycosyltransferase [Methylicorpusculum sp.]|uniref:glycosyltransferase family 2 protein n=1 Tax=Methylicorpusculum sp. TaxID=2713644 RepID=UPI00271DEAAB|nr:glycosyltransferase [Methylicorpusculum sp.]MDO8938539.1 glycosyltransferase [Methylicorpusculum sp.]MDO9239512.1 glycosyltransferase [Methylicorpusculum sp.]MDP2202089.1 glycosyltransferase [Methylicorpusculum sp.]